MSNLTTWKSSNQAAFHLFYDGYFLKKEVHFNFKIMHYEVLDYTDK